MIIEKEILSKTARDYIFLVGKFDLDIAYFKKRINEGIAASNLSYRTNVYGKHTAWDFFNKDPKLTTILMELIDHMESLPIGLDKFYLAEAWGLIEGFGEYTKPHHHNPSYLSGVLYLNDHHQQLHFPDIKQAITPKPGKVVIFSSWLSHHTKRNLKTKPKYGISFNFRSNTVLDNRSS